MPGILGTIQLAATLILALPIGLFGVSKLLAGDALIGGVAVAVAVSMVLLEEYLTTPTDLPTAAAQKVVGTVAKDPDEDD